VFCLLVIIGTISVLVKSLYWLKLAFHDADSDADTDTDILATILARMSVSVSVSASWNASFTRLCQLCLIANK